jgi:hypothetical protein
LNATVAELAVPNNNQLFMIYLTPTKDLHQMGGNSMAIRAVMAAISVVLSGLDPDLAQSYLNP